MDTVSAKVLGTIAIIFGVIFVVTSVARLFRPDLDIMLVVLNTTWGLLLAVVGTLLWRFAQRKAKAAEDSVR